MKIILYLNHFKQKIIIKWGRIIENIQKVNAVNIDKYGKIGKTSIRVINP